MEVGSSTTSGDKTFTWATKNDENIKPSSIEIEDTTDGTVLAVGLDNDGTEDITLTAISHDTATSHVWTIEGENTKPENNLFSKTFTVYWKWAAYFGSSQDGNLPPEDIIALEKDLIDERQGSYTTDPTANLTYRYIGYPKSFGVADDIKDPVTGLSIAMDENWSPKTMTIDNAYGITEDYYVYRTANATAGELTMEVS